MKRLLVAGSLVGLGTLPALAADLPVKAPMYAKAPAAVAYNWTGFYVGANAGVGLGRDLTSASLSNGFVAPLVANPRSYLGPLGVIGGGQIGYNWQAGNWVLGLETDIQASGMKDDQTCLHPHLGNGGLNCAAVGLGYSQKLDWFGTARARVGLATGPVLSYVTAGFAYGGVSTTVSDVSNFASNPTIATFQGTRTGYAYGSGVEASLGGAWTAKLEYLYLNLGSQSGTYPAFIPFVGANDPRTVSSDIREHIYRVGVNYRIGGNSVYAEPLGNWSGFYVGGNLGGAVARNVSRSVNNNFFPAGVSDDFNLMPNGYLGGAQAGYNWQTGSLVLGLEADIQGSSQRDNKACLFGCTTGFPTSDIYDQKLTWLGTARGRLGVSVGRTLFYGTAGAAFGSVQTTLTEASFGNPTVVTKFSQNRSGWTVGGGIESPFEMFGLLGPNWTSKTEYLYVDLGSSSGTYANVALGTTTAFTTRVTEHIFRSGLNYHFNNPVVAKY
jgi:outer membrane immunogenic protein